MTKTLSILIFLFIGTTTMVQAQEQPRKVDQGYQIKVKTSAICEMCQYAIEKALVYEKGVKIATLDLSTKEVTVVYNEKKTDPQTIRKRISLTGYHADSVVRDSDAYKALPECCKDGAHGTH